MLIFKLPFDEKYFTTDKNSEEKSVIFFLFKGNENIDFKGKIKEISFEEILKTNFVLHENIEFDLNETHDEYIKKIEKTISFIKENHLKKLVIARKKTVPIQNLNLPETFKNLCEKYPSAFVYTFIKNNECWMGAFSELLGKFNKKTSEFETMSLAGTLPMDEKWTEKEIEEQKPVTDYIFEIVKKYSENVEKSETQDHFSGNIKHLRTDFKAKIDADNVDVLISELHPTPAVCGIPKDFCRKAISDLENFDRELYAGYTRIETDENIYCFVNLRCGKFYKNTAVLFAGGGITALSSPQKEWQETELKMQALEKSLIENG